MTKASFQAIVLADDGVGELRDWESEGPSPRPGRGDKISPRGQVTPRGGVTPRGQASPRNRPPRNLSKDSRTVQEQLAATNKLAAKFDALVQEQILTLGIMGLDGNISVENAHGLIVKEACELDPDDLFRYLEKRKCPAPADTRKRLVRQLRKPNFGGSGKQSVADIIGTISIFRSLPPKKRLKVVQAMVRLGERERGLCLRLCARGG